MSVIHWFDSTLFDFSPYFISLSLFLCLVHSLRAHMVQCMENENTKKKRPSPSPAAVEPAKKKLRPATPVDVVVNSWFLRPDLPGLPPRPDVARIYKAVRELVCGCTSVVLQDSRDKEDTTITRIQCPVDVKDWSQLVGDELVQFDMVEACKDKTLLEHLVRTDSLHDEDMEDEDRCTEAIEDLLAGPVDELVEGTIIIGLLMKYTKDPFVHVLDNSDPFQDPEDVCCFGGCDIEGTFESLPAALRAIFKDGIDLATTSVYAVTEDLTRVHVCGRAWMEEGEEEEEEEE